jgi:hypothetical protein
VEGHTRRRLNGIVAAVLATICAASVASAAKGRVEQPGVFALLGGTPKIASKFWVSHPTGLSGTLKVRQFTSNGKPILNYDVDMEHIMHMVIVRDDFATFAHVHPDFDATAGTFWQTFTKEPNHSYYVYADSTPQGIGQQVFRFTLESSGAVARPAPVSGPSTLTANVGPYLVKLSKTTLPAGRAKNVNVTILKGDAPADDLAPYLGAAGHAVFINTSSLAYVHLHPMVRGHDANTSAPTSASTGMSGMEMGGGDAGPFMQLAVPALPAGTYKLWFQFLGNGTVYTAPFTLLAR